MESFQLESSIKKLLSEAGIDSGTLEFDAIPGGGNNRVFSVFGTDGRYLAKAYYKDASDSRDRLNAEFSFLSYAWDAGIRCIPRPISSNTELNMGLYEYVDGRKLQPHELNLQHAMQAARFIHDLNSGARDSGASSLATASEGGFSTQQHLSLIDARMRNLIEFPVVSEVDRQARLFVSELEGYWSRLKQKVSDEDVDVDAELRQLDRCISPSDFGFHNALIKESGEICFIDFEYAGWDDPAKMAGDFFSQPAIPVPLDFFDAFLNEALSFSPNKIALIERARRLLPVFQVKWCCIMLNEFLPEAAKRRRFANPTQDPEQNKRLQLQKAQKFFNTRLT